MHCTSGLVAFSLLALSHALPSNVARHPDSVLVPRAACTPVAGGSSSIDDVPAIATAIQSCGDGGTIVIPAGTTYNLNSVLDFTGCENCDFQIEGLLHFSGSTSFWEGKTAMIYVKNIAGVKIRSLTGSGVIDGNGQEAWDLFASNSSYARPTLLYITGGSSIEVSGLRQKNPPNVFTSVTGGAKDVTLSHLEFDATSKSSNEPKNTDGFDIGDCSYVTMSNLTVTNDDDCIALKPAADYVTIDTVTCTGSHGISIGSLGKGSDDTVSNIYASNVKMINSTKAAGIKTYPSGGDHGISTVSNVTFTDFTVENCGYAFQIQSCYGEDADYCETNPGNAQLTGITVAKFSGTTSSTYAPDTANLDCGSEGTCDVTISDYTVTSSSGEGEVLCANTPSDLGVTCTSGASG